MSRALRILILTVAVAYAVLIFPYARALWWLHAYASPPARYVLPVAGVAVDDLEPSFGAPRRHGPHEGIDILAPAGTKVLAAAEGVIIGNRSTPIGGNVLWIMGSGRRLYYYAHLRERAPGMRLGRLVHAGEVIGFVGNTGNAVHTPPHLHFAIYLVTSDFYPLRYGPMDPFPLLRSGSGRRQPGPRGQGAWAQLRLRA
jgi:murein DD-endopeptidase MepM/ murein hydrolase activator NlpD